MQLYIISKAHQQNPFKQEERKTGILSKIVSSSEADCHTSYHSAQHGYSLTILSKQQGTAKHCVLLASRKVLKN